MSIYVISAPEPPWGDYGDILMQGMASHLDRQDGLAQLERTAPFIPNLSFPDIDVIVVTDSFKVELETSGLTGFSFVPVIKARIVHLDWHRWDISADEPQEYPDSGEPEDYLLERPHSPELSEQVGLLWELRVSVSTTANRDNIFQQSDSWNGEDWFRVEDWGYTFVSERTRTWLEARVPNLVAFAPARALKHDNAQRSRSAAQFGRSTNERYNRKRRHDMETLLLSREEVARRAKALYEQSIRAQVETEENIGKMVIIDIETGDFEVDETGIASARDLKNKRPNARLYGIRIGYNVAEALGGVMERNDARVKPEDRGAV